MNLEIEREYEFKKLVNLNDYQAFLFSSKAIFPAFFAKHYWFVSNKNGKLKRWEVSHKRNNSKSRGYVWNHKKSFSKALYKYLWEKKTHWKKSKIEKIIEGKTAKNLIDILEKSPKEYPFKDNYGIYPGPNCNTFVQWIINQFPELDIKLSWNSFGKSYLKTNSS